MLDMNWIKDNQELVRNITAWKRVDFPLDELLEWDEKRRELRQDTEQLRAQRNGLTKEVERLLRQGDSVAGEAVKEQVRELNNRLNLYEADLTEANGAVENSCCSHQTLYRRIHRSAMMIKIM